VVGAAALTPIASVFGGALRDVPMFVALGLIAVLGNASAIRRLATIRAVVRSRDAADARLKAAE
jgi:hypothetical protein